MIQLISAIRYTAAVTAIASGICTAAQAGAVAGTLIGNVDLGVIDLTPGDGLAAGFDVLSFDSRLIVYTDTRASGGALDQQVAHPTPGIAASVHASMGGASSTAGTSGDIGNVVASAATPATLGQDNGVSGEAEQRLWLTLRPYSLLTVSGNVLTEAYRTLLPGEGYRVFTWASVDITDAGMITTSLLSRESALVWGEDTTAAANDEPFMLAFANPGPVHMKVNVNFLAYAEIAVTAVPEPSTSSMLVTGVIVAAALRRLRSKTGQFPLFRFITLG